MYVCPHICIHLYTYIFMPMHMYTWVVYKPTHTYVPIQMHTHTGVYLDMLLCCWRQWSCTPSIPVT